MAEPIYDETTERVYARLPEHFRRVDANQDYALKKYLESICSLQDEITNLIDRFDYVPPEDGGSPDDTSDLVDPHTADEKWLPWLAQLLGVNLTSRVIDQNTRNEIINASNGYKAGTQSAIIAAVQSELVGSKSVKIKKRTTNSGPGGQWDILIQTLQSETLSNILPSSIIVPSSIRNYHLESVPAGDTTRVSLRIAPNSAFYKSRALEFRAVPTGSGIGSETQTAGDGGYGVDEFGQTGFGTGDTHINIPEYFYHTPFYFPLDGSDPLTTMADVAFMSGSTNSIVVSAGIETFQLSGGTYTSLNEYIGSGDTTVPMNTIVRLVGRSEGINASATHGRFIVRIKSVGDFATVHAGHFGARKENNNIWVPRTANPVQAVIDKGAKPAGVKLWHTFETSSWDVLENGGTTTWNDLEALPSWTDVEEIS